MKFILYRTRNEFHLWICFRERYNDMVYSILLHTRYYIHGSRAVKKKTRPNPVSLWILNIMLPLPIIVPIHTCLFLINRYRLMRNAKRKRKKKKDTVGNEIIPFVPSLTEKGEIYWCIFFIGYWIWIRRDWRDSNPQLPPWQGGALTNWTTIPAGCMAYLFLNRTIRRFDSSVLL